MVTRTGIILFRDPIHLSKSRYEGEWNENDFGIWFYTKLEGGMLRRTYVPWSNVRSTSQEYNDPSL